MTKRVQVVTFIGAGGKTTCLRSLTREIDSTGHRVIATTTTKVFPEESMRVWKNPSPPADEQAGACFWYVDVEDKSGKWMGPPVSSVDAAIAGAGLSASQRTISALKKCKLENRPRLAKMQVQEPFPTCTSSRTAPNLHPTCMHWVIEGDGAKGLKLKCWAPREPQIPQRSDCVVLVLDGGLWGRVLQADQVHRPANCLDLLGQVWNAEQAWRYFLRSPVFAPQYGQMSWVILLNIHGENAENEDLVEPLKCLHDLRHRWIEIQWEVKDLNYRPKHLRITAGDAKEGKLQWFDLW